MVTTPTQIRVDVYETWEQSPTPIAGHGFWIANRYNCRHLSQCDIAGRYRGIPLIAPQKRHELVKAGRDLGRPSKGPDPQSYSPDPRAETPSSAEARDGLLLTKTPGR